MEFTKEQKREVKFRVREVFKAVESLGWSYFTLGDLACGNFSTNHEEFVGESWSQYTGLKDKNGKEIYEGDIVRFRTTTEFKNFKIEYINDYAQYWGVSFGGFSMTLYDLKREGEIIGNIYENPELMEVKNDN